MCTGLELLAMAATTGGSLINNSMQNAAIDEQNRQNRETLAMQQAARNDEVKRQRDFEQAQADLVTKALFEAAPERIQEEATAVADNPEDPINAAVDSFNPIQPAGQVQNEDVNESVGATIANKTAQTRALLRNAATLSGQYDGLSSAAEALGRMGSEVQTVGSNRRGSIAVSGMETNLPAPVVTPSDSIFGDLLMLGGQAAGGYLGNKSGAAGKKPFDIGGIFSNKRPLNAIPALGRINL